MQTKEISREIVSKIISDDDDFIVIIQDGLVVKTLIVLAPTEFIFEGIVCE